jgi:hypothetical protein
MKLTQLLAGSTLLLALTTGAARGQEEQERRELEAMLARVEAALAQLDPLVERKVTLAQYDVRHLMYRPVDRVAPALRLPSESAGFRTGAGAASFSFDAEELQEGAMFDPDQLVTAVTSTVGEEEWDDPCSIEMHRGYLLVKQTAIGHARIRRLLDDLTRRALEAIQLEVGFYALPAELEEQVRLGAIESGGVLGPALLARLDDAVRDGGAKLVGNAALTALDEQRVYVHQGTEQAYVADYERSSGGTGQQTAVVPDPIIEILRAGLALDVRPTLVDTGDGARVALDVRFTRSRPIAFEQRQTPWGPMTMPQVTMDSVRTSAQVPDGSGMLVFAARGTADDGTTDVVIVVRPRVLRQ